MDDWLDEAVRRGAPGPLGAEPVVANEAVAVAHAVVAAQRTRRKRMSRRGAFLGGAALSLGILGLGVTTAAAAPAVFEWFGMTPDLVAQRTFDFGDDELGLCSTYVMVDPIYRDVDAPDEEVDRRTEEARRFLTEHDWRPHLESITEGDIRAEHARLLVQRSELIESGGEAWPVTMDEAAMRVIGGRIRNEFEQAGYAKEGVSLTFGTDPCSDATESPAR